MKLAILIKAQRHVLGAVPPSVKLDEGLHAIEIRALLTEHLSNSAWVLRAIEATKDFLAVVPELRVFLCLHRICLVAVEIVVHLASGQPVFENATGQLLAHDRPMVLALACGMRDAETLQ